jgi:hypothetical protein
MPQNEISVPADQLRKLLDTVKVLSDAAVSYKQREDQRVRDDATRAENRQRQHSITIASDTADIHKKWEIAASYQPIYEKLGRETLRPSDSETADGYERRLLTGLQRYSKTLKDIDLYDCPDLVVRNFGATIRADASKADAVKTDIPAGVIKPVNVTDPADGAAAD